MINTLPSVQPQSKPMLKKLSRLGGGTYGRVYQAEMTPSKNTNPGALVAISDKEETVAVKRNFIAPAFDKTIGSIREMDILNLIKGHPYCVHLKNVSFEVPFSDGALSPAESNWVSDKVYFVLEKGQCNGDNYIRGYQGIPGTAPPLVNERKLFITQILLALEFLHSRGVYHRDIKPANIICFNDSKDQFQSAKLTDFGLSQYYTPQMTSAPGFVTLWYRAPEISLSKEYDYKSDVWSMGCILFEMFSGANQRFIQPSNDEQLVNKLIAKLPFPEVYYTLSQQLYLRKITSNYYLLQRALVPLEQQLNCTESQIAQFNSMILGGRVNFGTFAELVDLLQHMLVVDPEQRWTTSQCLNHSFFNGIRDLINQTRLEFGINEEGIWVMAPPPTLNYRATPVRARGMEWFQRIYTHRVQAPVVVWYSHQIFIHALEMFDRFLLMDRIQVNPHESQIVIWVNTLCFMSAKYFRVLTTDLGLNSFSLGIIPEELQIFRQRAEEFEEHLVKDVFKYTVYVPTIFETAEEFLTENAIAHFLRLIIRGEIPPGIRLKTLYHSQSKIVAMKNQQQSYVPTPRTPVVSMSSF